MLQFVAELHQGGATGDMVEAALKGRFPMDATTIQQQPTTTTQQPTATRLLEVIEAAVKRSVQEEIGQVMAEVAALNEKVDRLTAALSATPQPTATTQQQQQQQRPPARPWWAFWRRNR